MYENKKKGKSLLDVDNKWLSKAEYKEKMRMIREINASGRAAREEAEAKIKVKEDEAKNKAKTETEAKLKAKEKAAAAKAAKKAKRKAEQDK